MFDPKAIGKNVKEARMKAGLSQSALADGAGFSSAAQISRFENGHRTLSLEALDSIARALHTTLTALLGPDYSGHEAHETAGESDFEKQERMPLPEMLAEIREIKQEMKKITQEVREINQKLM